MKSVLGSVHAEKIDSPPIDIVAQRTRFAGAVA
jgi:hypothetical protein